MCVCVLPVSSLCCVGDSSLTHYSSAHSLTISLTISQTQVNLNLQMAFSKHSHFTQNGSILLRPRTTIAAPPLPRLPDRSFSTRGLSGPQSRHKLWYTETLPALVPIFLLGSAVYLACHTAFFSICCRLRRCVGSPVDAPATFTRKMSGSSFRTNQAAGE